MKTKEMKITKREVIVSIAIIALMLIVGFLIGGKITDWQNDKNAEYQKAIHIDDTEMFEYGMKTNVGRAFVYGDLEAVDTVSFPEIDGQYMYVKKVEKRYERHTRTVTKEDSEGNSYTETETYYEWDVYDTESKHISDIKFCGVVFPYEKIVLPESKYICTVQGNRVFSWKSSEYVRIKFEYYGVSTKHTGTIYTKLKDGSITDKSKFYENYSIEQTLEYLTSDTWIIVFWILWIILTVVAVFGFYYLDNKWLED